MLKLGLALPLGASFSNRITSGAGGVHPPVGPVIGGYRVGDQGAPGSIYEGLYFAWGYNFESAAMVDTIIGPANPRAKFGGTKTYSTGPRGSDASQLSKQYDTDPFWTGHNDSNRGVPVGSDNLAFVTEPDGRRSLRQTMRTATAKEIANFQGAGRYAVGSTIEFQPAIQLQPGAAGTGDVIFEWNCTKGPGVQHSDWWMRTANEQGGLRQDLNYENQAPTHVTNAPLDADSPGGFTTSGTIPADGVFRTLSMRLNKDHQEGGKIFRDGSLVATLRANGNLPNKLTRALSTAHYVFDELSEANLAAQGNTGYNSNRYVRVWIRTGQKHFKPLTAVPDINIANGAPVAIQLPSKTALWGADFNGTELVYGLMMEENEPGGEHATLYTTLPAGLSYDATARTISGTITSTKSGRLRLLVSAQQDGCSCEPLNILVHVGPRLNLVSMEYEVGVPFSLDLYPLWDCGVLTTDGVNRKKAITVSGLPAWAVYNTATDRIEGTPTDTGASTITTTCTNSLGQAQTSTFGLAKKVVAVASFATAFTTADNTLDAANLGFSRIDGSAGGALIRSNQLRANDATTNGTAYASPLLTEGNHYVEGRLINDSTAGLCHRLTSRDDNIHLRRNTSTALQVMKKVGGVLSGPLAQFTPSPALTSTDVVRFEDLGTTFRVLVNGVALTPSSGSLTFPTAAGSMPPSINRQGILVRSAAQTIQFLDDFAAATI